jgi:hypothetical protein
MLQVYFFLLAILFAVVWAAGKRVVRAQSGLTPILGWLTGICFFIVLPLVLLVVNGGYRVPDKYMVRGAWGDLDLSSGVYLVPFLVIWISLLTAFALLYFLAPVGRRAAPRQTEVPVNHRRLKRVLLLTMAVSAAEWVLLIWAFGGVEEYFSAHWYIRFASSFDTLGEIFVLYLKLSQANQVIFTAAAALLTAECIRRRKFEWKWLAACIIFLLLEMVMSGNRIFIALYGCAFLASSLCYRFRLGLVAVVLAVPFAVFFFAKWAEVRGDLTTIDESIQNIADAQEQPPSPVMTALMDSTEGANVMLLMNIVNDFGDRYPYLYGESYAKGFLFFIPRSIFPSKPMNFAQEIADIYEPEAETSFSTTVLGELYANFGPACIVLLPIVTGMVWYFSSRVWGGLARHPLESAILFIMAVWFARSAFSDNFITLLMAFLVVRGLRLEKNLHRPAIAH